MKTKAQSEFTIPYLGLMNGAHNFDFILDDVFLSSLEKSSIEKGRFEMMITFDKQDRMIVLTINCSGYYNADCDRCLAPIQVPMIYEDQVIIKVEEAPSIKKDEVYYVEPSTSHIDIAPFMVESLHLHLPMQNIRECEEEGYTSCDQEVLKNLGVDYEEAPERENPWGELGKLNLE